MYIADDRDILVCDEIDYARMAKALKQSEVFAVGDDFVIVRSVYPEIVMQINQDANKDKGILLMGLLANKHRQIFAVNQNTSEKLVSSFKELSARKIPLVAADKLDFSYLVEPEEKEEENRLYKIFGKDGVEVV